MDEFIDQPTLWWPRAIAAVLALGGAFWGVFLLGAFGPAVLISLPFGVGYLVTATYITRAVSIPSLATRRAFWIMSAGVQGAWLLFVGIPELLRIGPDLFFCWWAFATAMSVVALAIEPGNTGDTTDAAPDRPEADVAATNSVGRD